MDKDRRKFLKFILAAGLSLACESGGILLPRARAASQKGEEPKMGATTEGVEISAREYWNKTGIVLTKGKRYSFVTEGEWRDASHPCDADGWVPEWGKTTDKILEYLKRESGQRLFKLIGAVDKKRPYIVLGAKGSFEAPASGELFCFANDVPGFYRNNSGKVTLKIQAES